MILRFQRQNLIETDSSSTDSDYNENDPLRLMENKSVFVRLLAYGRLKKMMVEFKEKPLDNLERNMMKGMFKRRLKDFKELWTEKQKKMPLYERLKGGLDDEMKGFGDRDDENVIPLAELQTRYKGNTENQLGYDDPALQPTTK